MSRLALIWSSAATLWVAALPPLYAQTGVLWPATPLFIGLNVPPNLVLAVDDSTSMDFEVLLPTNDGALWWHASDQSFVGRDINDSLSPGTINYNKAGNGDSTWTKYVYLFPNGQGTGNRSAYDSERHFAIPPLPQYAFLRSSVYNKAYYNPLITYTPWPSSYGTNFTNATPTAAISDPARGGTTIDLTNNLTSSGTDWTFRVQPGMKYIGSGGTVATYSTEASVAMTYYPATYYLPTTPKPSTPYNGNRSNCQSPKTQDYKDFEQNPAMALPAGVHAIGPDGQCLTRYEIKPGNTFPSGRAYAMEMQNFANWFVYHRKRHLATRGAILRAFDDVRGIYLATFAINNRTNPLPFYEYPGNFSGSAPSGKTTLYNSVKDYVNRAGTPNREALNHIGAQLSRASNSPLRHVCQKNYGILFTDGFASHTAVSGIGNEDGAYGAPYADSYSGTLADISMKYYRELRTGGRVPVNPGCGQPGSPAWLDCNTAWHMNTYAVTLGTRGTIFGVSHFNREDAYRSPPPWPQPNIQRHPYMIDDLYHATINGRGEMLNAEDTASIQRQLRQIIDTIVAQTGSGGGVSLNTFKLSTQSRVFYARFDSDVWAGDLLAYPIGTDGIDQTPVWRASAALPSAMSRRIFTVSGGNAREFLYSALSPLDQAALVSAAVVDYLRGDRSQEIQNGGVFRNRPSNNVLGDIAHFTPVYLRENNTVFVGTNAGMLHAFDAETGREHFAFVPSQLLPRLVSLTSPAYQHDYFVDGQAAITSKIDTHGRNFLVVTLGRGGKGLFALDVTHPDTASGTELVKWENYGTSDSDMGHILGQPVIAKMNNGDWAVVTGNGYGSVSQKSVLYIYRLSDGAVLKKFDTGVGGNNGMSPPSVIDVDGDGRIDYIYAGDLKGNVWRIDATDANPNQWKFLDLHGSQAKPFFSAANSTGVAQPITAPIAPVVNPLNGQRMLLFGTGSYFRLGDPTDTSTQSWYGLVDGNTAIAGRTELTARAIQSEGFYDSKPVRTFTRAAAGDLTGKKGWYLDFTGGVGERIAGQTVIADTPLGRVALSSSLIPSSDPCIPGGRGYLNVIDPFTGGGLTGGVLDVNENRNFEDDKLGGLYIGSVDLGVGMPNKPELTDGRVVVPGTQGMDSLPLRQVKPALGRLNWREIIRN